MYIYIYKIPWTYTYKYIQMKKIRGVYHIYNNKNYHDNAVKSSIRCVYIHGGIFVYPTYQNHRRTQINEF